MRVRYQSNPRISLFGMILSLGLILGAHEALQAGASAGADEAEATTTTVGEPLGVGMVNVSALEETARVEARRFQSC